MRRAHGVDANQADIVNVLREVGYSVLDLSAVGGGCPDLLVGGVSRRSGERINVLIEVKTAKGRIRKNQMEFADNWRGPLYIARTIEEALLAAMGV